MAQTRYVTFEERVKAQRAIERVYFSHRISPSRRFEDHVSDAVLRQKVTTYLLQSSALGEYWSSPVTGEALVAELERIQKQTLYPARLEEIYDALGNDSILIQETFVRSSLVGRLSRSFFANDRRIHGESWHATASL